MSLDVALHKHFCNNPHFQRLCTTLMVYPPKCKFFTLWKYKVWISQVEKLNTYWGVLTLLHNPCLYIPTKRVIIISPDGSCITRLKKLTNFLIFFRNLRTFPNVRFLLTLYFKWLVESEQLASYRLVAYNSTSICCKYVL